MVDREDGDDEALKRRLFMTTSTAMISTVKITRNLRTTGMARARGDNERRRLKIEEI
jgi:hypothetical protein